MQNIIDEPWGDDDGWVAYVRIDGTDNYRVLRGSEAEEYQNSLDASQISDDAVSEVPSGLQDTPTRLPYKPVITPWGRCARNGEYLWRHKPCDVRVALKHWKSRIREASKKKN